MGQPLYNWWMVISLRGYGEGETLSAETGSDRYSLTIFVSVIPFTLVVSHASEQKANQAETSVTEGGDVELHFFSLLESRVEQLPQTLSTVGGRITGWMRQLGTPD